MTSKSQIKASRQYYQRHKEQVQQTKKEYYEKIKEAKKKRQMELYWQKKKEQTSIKQPTYTAKDIKILMSLKTYAELNKEKQGLVREFWNAVIELPKLVIYTASNK